jgi:hypothetical protein
MMSHELPTKVRKRRSDSEIASFISVRAVTSTTWVNTPLGTPSRSRSTVMVRSTDTAVPSARMYRLWAWSVVTAPRISRSIITRDFG